MASQRVLCCAVVAVLASCAWGPFSRAAPADSTAAPSAAPEAPCKPAGPSYTTKYDNMNVDMILKNERVLKAYIDCLMDRKPCTREGQVLKDIIPDALCSECARCSEKQKQQAGKILHFLVHHKPHYWEELLSKYDPKGIFRTKFEVPDEEGDDDEDDDEECDGEDDKDKKNDEDEEVDKNQKL